MATLRPGRTSARHWFSATGSVSMTSMRPVGFSRSRRNVRARVKPRGNHAAVVEDEQVAFAEMLAEVGEEVVID